MRIVVYTRSLLKGGAEKQALLLSEQLQKTNNVLLVVHEENEVNNCFSSTSIKNLVYLHGNLLAKCLQLFRILRSEPSLIISFLPVNNIIGTVAGKFADCSHIFCGIRSSKQKSKLKTLALKFICNQLNVTFISNSYVARDFYINMGFKSENIKVIHNGIYILEDNNQIFKSIQSKNPIRVISVGRYVPEKDFFTLIKAAGYLVHGLGCNQIRFKLIGYGPLKAELHQYISDNGLNEYIELVDGNTDDLWKYYLSADIFVLTSKYEGMPNTVMEAMSYKLPIVTTDAGDAKYLVENDQNGFVVDVGDFKSIAAAVLKISTDPVLYSKFSKNSYDKIYEGFRAEKLASEYLKFL